MTEKIKPCPLCGSANVDVFSSFRCANTDHNFMNVECIDCGAQGPSRKGEDNAIAAWNKRAYSTAHAGSEPVNSEMLAIISDYVNNIDCMSCRKRKENARNLLRKIKGTKS